ncbi:uncharacterized protein LOC143287510 [Babylonia areolata]|uniref:uncharacterized protein LOC143287510 n=1 Tax=Babylonia areolata TaxID=304850 RepID=UPI003FD56AA1
MSWTGSHHVPGAGFMAYRDFQNRRTPVHVVPGPHHPSLVRNQRLEMHGGSPSTYRSHPQLHGSHTQLQGTQSVSHPQNRPQMASGHGQMNGGHPQMNGVHPQINGVHPQMNGRHLQVNGGQPQVNGGHPQMNGGRPQEPDENWAVREAYRKERKIESYLADDLNFPNFAKKLKEVGLQLRDIPADGNCLFRALGDQLEGHCRNHYRHRQEVVQYMLEHRKDFEPFVEDDLPFDDHLSSLKKLGTHAGNDAIVAFAKLHNVNVFIHQLRGNPIQISGPSSSANVRQVHIAYHNGDHYSSIRRHGDNTESPANIRIQESSKPASQPAPVPQTDEGVVTVKRDLSHLEAEVIHATGCQDAATVRETLKNHAYDVDATIAFLVQTLGLDSTQGGDDTTSVGSHQTTDSGIWAANGSPSIIMGGGAPGKSSVKGKGQKVHFREDSFGGSSGYSSMGSNRGGGMRPKLVIAPTPVQYHVLTGSKAKEFRKMEKKRRM